MANSEDNPNNSSIKLDWRTLPRSYPIERIARALCKFDGYEPDSMSRSERTELFITDDGIATQRYVEIPAWKNYIKEAMRLSIAFEAFLDNGSDEVEFFEVE